MKSAQHKQLARTFRALHDAGSLLLPNAWDAASARVFEAEGLPAIATTSSGIAFARGYCDGEVIGRDGMVREVASIVRAVGVPVSADVEAGYGPGPEDVAETVRAILRAGAVGINLEDCIHAGGSEPLFSIEAQAARLAAARAESDRRGLALTINARTDTFLLGLGADRDERVAMTIERGRAYLAAGADLVFVPVLVDLGVVRQLAGAFDGRLSLMAMPGAPPAAAMFAAGARRVSLGHTAALAALGTVRAIARELRANGTWGAIERSFFGFREAKELFEKG
jgi:2-methylisocitrate lyase-like PEP mutase family enzyme